MICSKILVAYDGSVLGKKSLQKAIELASTNSSIEIEVLHVVPQNPYVGFEYAPTETELQMLMEEGRIVLETAENMLSGTPNTWNTVVLTGFPAMLILEYVRASSCDLIMMGSRGLSGLKELFLGSVSHHVVQHSPVPVFVVK